MTDAQKIMRVELQDKQLPLTEAEVKYLTALGNLRDAEASGVNLVECQKALVVAEKEYNESIVPVKEEKKKK